MKRTRFILPPALAALLATAAIPGPAAHADLTAPPAPPAHNGSPAAPVNTPAAPAEAREAVSPPVYLAGNAEPLALEARLLGGHTLAPAEALLTALGYEVSWNPDMQLIEAQREGRQLRLYMDSPHGEVDGQPQPLPAPARLIEGEPYIPLRWAAQADGRKVDWRSADRSIVIHRQGSIQSTQSLVPLRVVVPVPGDLTEELLALAPMTEALSEQLGATVELTAVKGPHYQDKANLMIAAGDLPDLLYLPEPYLYEPGLLSSIATELTDRIADYPHLAALPEAAWQQIAMGDDAVYGVPRPVSPVDAPFPALRRDLLDRYGLAVPQTMDELLTALREMQAQGERGQLLAAGADGGAFDWALRVYNASGSRLKETDAGIVDTLVSEATRDALQWLRTAYEEGLIDPDYARVTADELPDLLSGDTALGAVAGLDIDLAAAGQANAGDEGTLVELLPLTALRADADAAPITAAGPAHEGLYIIPRMSTAEEAEQALQLLDLLADPQRVLGDPTQDALADELLGDFGHPDQALAGTDSANAPVGIEAVRAARSEIHAAQPAPVQPARWLRNDDRVRWQEWAQELTELQDDVITGRAALADWDDAIAALQADSDYMRILELVNG
ncbi:extracellular solute-binding protein [Paenibacillus sp. IB182496]|uniref:Extracellular solute-binding protein n=1 Tax=Paenibacillus sabuli TaxID=2772509 RepID=A0A927BP77_9BACL|nr:extracellular solute-binding protein [Paenibacillus sabuli]MBD2844181.1 extracellular solute-binding protein [Paenibacillus sabuli]